MACVFFEQGLDAPTILLVKGPKVLNYLVDNGINIDEIDVGGMGARKDRTVLYKNISTNGEEKEQFNELLDKKVNVYIQVMPQDNPVSISEYLR